MDRPEPLELELLAESLAVCRLSPEQEPPAWALAGRFYCLTRSERELSIVCPQELVPAGVEAERGWRGLRVAGRLDFALTGVLASLLEPLAGAGVAVFVVSTYETDYLLVKADRLEPALAALGRAGHVVRRDPETETEEAR